MAWITKKYRKITKKLNIIEYKAKKKKELFILVLINNIVYLMMKLYLLLQLKVL